MTIGSVWLNLPVNDIEKSRKFFQEIGFKINPKVGDSKHAASFLIGESNFVLMLFPNDAFMNFAQNKVADTKMGNEVLISFDAQSKEEVDNMAKTVAKAGGKIFGKPGETLTWLYAFGFEDLDGHRWNMLYTDMSKMPTAAK